MIIGFKKQFVEPILQGTKVHTIREDKANRWKAGMVMHMYTGGRFSKEYRQFAEKQCISVQDIFMTYYNAKIEVTIDESYLFGYSERLNFAIRDGFKDWDDFENYWIPVITADTNRTFRGI